MEAQGEIKPLKQKAAIIPLNLKAAALRIAAQDKTIMTIAECLRRHWDKELMLVTGSSTRARTRTSTRSPLSTRARLFRGIP
jgi:hypothetical protein